MSTLSKHLAVLLSRLDQHCPLNRPVLIERDLIPLIKEVGNIDTVVLVPIDAREIAGVHLGKTSEGRVAALFHRCAVHHERQFEPKCPGCQTARFEVAKELVHSLDGEDEKTAPDEAAERLLQQLVRRAFEGAQAMADGFGGVAAVEVLIRYPLRVFMLEGSGRNPAYRLSVARATDNYSELATMFAVPPVIVKHAFSEPYMLAMKAWREAHGLSTAVPEITFD